MHGPQGRQCSSPDGLNEHDKGWPVLRWPATIPGLLTCPLAQSAPNVRCLPTCDGSLSHTAAAAGGVQYCLDIGRSGSCGSRRLWQHGWRHRRDWGPGGGCALLGGAAHGAANGLGRDEALEVGSRQAELLNATRLPASKYCTEGVHVPQRSKAPSHLSAHSSRWNIGANRCKRRKLPTGRGMAPWLLCKRGGPFPPSGSDLYRAW